MLFRMIRLYDSKTRSVSPARKLRSDPGFPHISSREMYHARQALLTVFYITQSDHSITFMSIHDITDLEKLLECIRRLILIVVKNIMIRLCSET
jgi:hypothetical protein